MKFNLKQENINYVKLTYKDTSDFTHCVKASIKSITPKAITVTTKFDKNLYIKCPQATEISFACDNGLFIAKTEIKMVEKVEFYNILTIKIPENVEHQQNREFFRVKTNEDVILKFNNSMITGKICDLSANGIKVELKDETDIPKNLLINILFEKEEIKAQAKFIRMEYENNAIQASFAFTNLSAAEIDFISQKCIQKQLEHKRNSLYL